MLMMLEYLIGFEIGHVRTSRRSSEPLFYILPAPEEKIFILL